ncbi:LOW QUALITY PROTEIN: germacrene D synthase 2-like [Salvia hispanica]|uniref:LOW QUALITY PROTEIN: germacrene D synthase 2-like n=1 Tax=Salvia hispanica TaxID=49212 RepID=UPI0020093997|nr:LOW QUALITY PROTEIN: germacrene D synthase 2-like [Salvia hispanica]
MEHKNHIASITTSSRPLANFHPNVWGDRFLVYSPQPCKDGEKGLVEKLKEEVKVELKEASNDIIGLLKLVDAIQRLGIEYHFEEEIDQAKMQVNYILWWKDLEVPTKLFYARDRMVECYFWIMGAYFEPKYAKGRHITTKMIAIASLFDDTFDAYATFEELELFMVAIERWSMSCLDEIPEYMRGFYKALLEAFEDIEEYMIKKGTLYRLDYGIEAMKVMARDYFTEIKWREEKYKPKSEEYMHVATASSAYTSLIICSFLGMGDCVTKEAFEFVLSLQDIVKATLNICRLTDDIVGHEFERKREHIPSMVECYTEEHNKSKEEAVDELLKRIETAWKLINEAFLKPTKIPTPLLTRILNFARVIEVIYSKGDWYTHVGPEMQKLITQLLIDPVP